MSEDESETSAFNNSGGPGQAVLMVEHEVCICLCWCAMCVCVHHRLWTRLELKHVIALTKHWSEYLCVNKVRLHEYRLQIV